MIVGVIGVKWGDIKDGVKGKRARLGVEVVEVQLEVKVRKTNCGEQRKEEEEQMTMSLSGV
eukprot:scaffold5777_cov66-Attheya_sp.AAC.1